MASGGFAIGVWAVGGLAVGVQALGAVVAGWTAASGNLAIAHDFALGERASLALHANDSAARAMVGQSAFFQYARAIERHAVWMNLIFLAPFAWRMWSVRRAGRDRAGIGTK
jgi:hypothetical protein